MGRLLKETPYSEITATLEVLTAMGVERKHFNRIRSDKVCAERVAESIIFGGLKNPMNQEIARGIMGKNFFGIEEAIKYFGIKPSRQQLTTLSEIPFSVAVLEQLKETYILIAVFPLSILEIRSKFPFCSQDKINSEKLQNKQSFFSGQASYDKEFFANEHGKDGKASWQLILKTPVPGSIYKCWSEQLDLLDENDEVPSARVMVYTVVGHYLSTGERLFKQIYIRTSSIPEGLSDFQVTVGDAGFGSMFLAFYNRYDDGRSNEWGISSARKPRI